jgi:hypothetical protein
LNLGGERCLAGEHFNELWTSINGISLIAQPFSEFLPDTAWLFQHSGQNKLSLCSSQWRDCVLQFDTDFFWQRLHI